jgi:hypothetical protein
MPNYKPNYYREQGHRFEYENNNARPAPAHFVGKMESEKCPKHPADRTRRSDHWTSPMGNDGDNGHAGDDTKGEVCDGKAFRAHHGFGENAEYPETGNVGEQMKNAAVQKHIGE